MNIINNLANVVGSAIRSYRQAVLSTPRQKPRRPAFLGGMAEAEKWKGGDLGAKDAAYKRALQNSWIYTAINYKANELAAGRLYVARNKSGLDGDSVPLKAHPFSRILRKPNELMGRGFLWRYTQWWLDLSGNAYWFLAPDEDNNLAEIWPLPANLVNPMPGDQNRMVDYYEYTVNGRVWPVPSEYVCHFRYPNPYDYFRGLAPLVAALLASDSDSAMAYWNGAFFGKQNTMPSAVINLSSGDPQTPLEPADLESVKEQLESDFSASNRRTVVTNAFDMAVQILGWNARDMDFFNGRSFSRDEIYGIYGMPAGMFDKSATEANSTTADNVFKEKTLWPLMTSIYADSITAQIMERWYDPADEAMFEDIRPINRAMLIQEANATLPDLTRAERRARFWNLPPLGDARDTEIPGSASPQIGGADAGASSGAWADQFPLPNPQNAVPEMRALSPEALQELRRWKRLSLKSLQAGQSPAIQFSSAHIPASLKAAISDALQDAGDADDVKDLFSQQISSLQPGQPTPQNATRDDDPFKPIKRAAEKELEHQLNEYFSGLAERVQQQIA